jgi:hypothetical protein
LFVYSLVSQSVRFLYIAHLRGSGVPAFWNG